WPRPTRGGHVAGAELLAVFRGGRLPVASGVASRAATGLGSGALGGWVGRWDRRRPSDGLSGARPHVALCRVLANRRGRPTRLLRCLGLGLALALLGVDAPDQSKAHVVAFEVSVGEDVDHSAQ